MKQSKADFLRSWSVPYPQFRWDHLRYKNPPEKGVYWFFFSLYIRERDVEKWGTCISCNKPITVDTCDAGHFIPAFSCGRDLLFSEQNVNAECPRCNAWDEGHLFGYERGLAKRYGAAIPGVLKDKYWQYKLSDVPVKEWKAERYAELIRKLPTYQRVCNVAP